MTAEAAPLEKLNIRRNTILLATCMATFAGGLQLSVALSTVTFVLVSGIEGLLGIGPAIFMSAGGTGALVAGRAMDRYGRVPVLAGGFVLGLLGSVVTGLGVHWVSTALVIVGFCLLGAGNGTIILARAAGGDLYPPERRARGISYVLFGSVFGAILGPAVFVPLFAGKDLDTDALFIPWLASGGFMVAGLAIALSVRPDPRRIALILSGHAASPDRPTEVLRAARLGEIVRRPGVVPALLAALASYGVMVAVMNLTGHMVVEHGHAPERVFPIISAHVVGMFGLVLVVGDIIDRTGRRLALVGGLVVMGVSVLSLVWITSVPATALSMFGLGIGWVFSFVAATAELIDRTSPIERGKLLGFNDLLSAYLAAALALVGGYGLSSFGDIAIGIGGAVVVVVPALWILRMVGRAASSPAAATLRSR